MLPSYLLDLPTEDDLTSLFGRACTLAMPYAVVDGVNEKGLCVSILELEGDMTAQDTDKPDVMPTFAVRILLDKCANVEEAVVMLNRFDMNAAVGAPYHFFLADSNGNSVIVEWPENRMQVKNVKYVTNFRLIDGPDNALGQGFGHERYDIIEKDYQQAGGVFSEKGAMGVLEDAKNIYGVEGDWDTEYSVVYNLDKFTAAVCSDMDYGTVYTFPQK